MDGTCYVNEIYKITHTGNEAEYLQNPPHSI